MKNTLIRSFTGLIYLIIFIGALILGPYSFGFLFFAVSLIALMEFYRIVRFLGYKPHMFLGALTGAVFFIGFFLYGYLHISAVLISLSIPLIILILILAIYSKETTALQDSVFTIFGLLYIVFPISLFNYFAFFLGEPYNYHIVLGFFILLWANDTFAYVFGVSFGKHRLMEKISPKKSWEGFIGGTIFTIILALIMSSLMNILLTRDWIIMGAIISLAGVFGDLFESLIKRLVNIKDSGRLLPGHGGMLDRIDSALLSSPLVFVYLLFINNSI